MNVEGRRANAVRYYHEVKSATKAAKRFSVSPQTIYNLAKAEKNGPAQSAGVLDGMREDHLQSETLRLEAENLRLTERLAAMTRLLASYLNS